MCIAIVKPKNVDFPTKKQFMNCFESNPHGAGFMYSDGENIIIKKGYMTFESFYNAFVNENIDKSHLVFFHFRIATHGLVDGGNTHPFPVVNNVDLLRKTELKFKGYGLIHNGVIYYDKKDFFDYDKRGIISDTMLMSMKLADAFSSETKKIYSLESAIAYNFYKHFSNIDKIINQELSYNKVAIMNEKEEYVKYGDWIENDGIFYSNHDFDESYNINYGGYYTSNDGYLIVCDNCGDYFTEDEITDTDCGCFCKSCLSKYNTFICSCCKMVCFKENNSQEDICDNCLEQFINENDENDYVNDGNNYTNHFYGSNKSTCDYCGDTNVKTTEVDNEFLCDACLKSYFKKCPLCNHYVSILYNHCSHCGTKVNKKSYMKCLDCGEIVEEKDIDEKTSICKNCWEVIKKVSDKNTNKVIK